MEKNKEKKPENPLAFPDLAVIRSGEHLTQQIRQSGMFLRDYFAAKAIVGLISSDPEWIHDSERSAMLAYNISDAMLKQREL